MKRIAVGERAKEFGSAIDQRGIALLVMVRRGGQSREDAIRQLERADQEDGKSVASWWMEQIVGDFEGGALPKDELEQAARNGFVKGLDEFIYEPGTRSLSRKLGKFLRRCIRSEIISEIRKATTKVRRMETHTTDDDSVTTIAVTTDSADAELQASIIESYLDEDDAIALRRLLETDDGGKQLLIDEEITADQLMRIREVASEVLGRVL